MTTSIPATTQPVSSETSPDPEPSAAEPDQPPSEEPESSPSNEDATPVENNTDEEDVADNSDEQPDLENDSVDSSEEVSDTSEEVEASDKLAETDLGTDLDTDVVANEISDEVLAEDFTDTNEAMADDSDDGIAESTILGIPLPANNGQYKAGRLENVISISYSETKGEIMSGTSKQKGVKKSTKAPHGINAPLGKVGVAHARGSAAQNLQNENLKIQLKFPLNGELLLWLNKNNLKNNPALNHVLQEIHSALTQSPSLFAKWANNLETFKQANPDLYQTLNELLKKDKVKMLTLFNSLSSNWVSKKSRKKPKTKTLKIEEDIDIDLKPTTNTPLTDDVFDLSNEFKPTNNLRDFEVNNEHNDKDYSELFDDPSLSEAESFLDDEASPEEGLFDDLDNDINLESIDSDSLELGESSILGETDMEMNQVEGVDDDFDMDESNSEGISFEEGELGDYTERIDTNEEASNEIDEATLEADEMEIENEVQRAESDAETKQERDLDNIDLFIESVDMNDESLMEIEAFEDDLGECDLEAPFMEMIEDLPSLEAILEKIEGDESLAMQWEALKKRFNVDDKYIYFYLYKLSEKKEERAEFWNDIIRNGNVYEMDFEVTLSVNQLFGTLSKSLNGSKCKLIWNVEDGHSKNSYTLSEKALYNFKYQIENSVTSNHCYFIEMDNANGTYIKIRSIACKSGTKTTQPRETYHLPLRRLAA